MKGASRGRKKVVLVGDAQHDEESARSLGVDFVMVGSYRELPSTLGRVVDACAQAGGAAGDR
ncbi:MAG: HAD family hydrolase [Sulfolobales archaeon]|nr:HAD family hydrolase [Sulfolobales archaeon]